MWKPRYNQNNDSTMVKMETEPEPSTSAAVQVVLPGDSVKQVSPDASIKLGPGVMQLPVKATGDDKSKSRDSLVHITATRSGILGIQKASNGKKGQKSAAELCWVEARSKRVGGHFSYEGSLARREAC